MKEKFNENNFANYSNLFKSKIMFSDASIVLNLSRQDLTEVPDNLVIPQGVSRLNLSGNKIRHFCKIYNEIRAISLRNNDLAEIQKGDVLVSDLLSFSELHTLDLSENKIKIYDDLFKENKIIKNLILYNNKLEEVTISNQSINNLDLSMNSLKHFPQIIPYTLKSLKLNNNSIEEIHDSFPLLGELYIKMNGLKSIDHNVIFSSLQVLDISRNDVSELPNFEEFAPKIQKFFARCNFLTIFPNLPNTITHVNIHMNEIDELPNLSECFPHLIEFDMSYNQIKRLPMLPASLQFLHAEHNLISEVEPCSAKSLKSINLSSNLLTSFPCIKAHSLTEINYKSNQIREIDVKYISKNVTKLFLSNNFIADIPSSLFDLKCLQILRLCNNKIRTIPSNIKNSKLISLSLTLNPLEKLPVFPISLRKLYIGSCNLTELPSTLSSLDKLNELFASGNDLTDISIVESLHKLQILRVSRNQIVEFPLNLPSSITTLDISYNNIRELPKDMFFPNLIDFDFSYNSIQYIPDSFYSYVKNIYTLRGSNNCLAKKQIIDLRSLNKLRIVDFSGTMVPVRINNELHQIILNDPKRNQKNHSKINYVIRHKSVGYAEMKGIREKMEDSIIIHHSNELSVYAIFDGHCSGCPSKYSSFYFREEFIKKGKMSENFFKRTFSGIQKKLKQAKAFGGTTAAVVIIGDTKMMTAHIGDSRILVLSEDGSVILQTSDHKPDVRSEFDRIRKEGGFIENMRVGGRLAVARSLGDFSVIGVGCKPEIISHDLSPSDRWLIIGCDGFFDVLELETISMVCRDAKSPSMLAYDLRNLAYGCMSTDNISVVVIDLKEHNAR
ncbi:hypothetical protein TRFO_30137 [Tritrichomonas foetus]|uniref:PPM-type phosphatase domain-containing protein n=1 Tax=Tritrichomonas foetus TaxID=1144522 RepID=A0A1J4JU67_9EUKA|nr:hypothetical protein TRFO_30137 [Tritrichomonas foetus]|eukprot:OHT02695.1 hypothetical protein TRFO_30137 [Tritrichomonas foetus]